MSGWRAGERPGDVLRAIAALHPELDDPDTADVLLSALGLVSEQSVPDLPVADVEVRPDPWPRLLLARVGRTARRLRPWPVTTLGAAVAGIATLIGGVAFLLTGSVAVGVGLGVVAVVVQLILGLVVLGTRPRPITAAEPGAGDQPSITVALVSSKPREEPPTPTLVAPKESRALAQALTVVSRPSGRPDIARARTEMERGRSPIPLRQEWRPRSTAVVQVLVDIGDSMGPLRDDADQLIEALQEVIGTGHLERCAFKESPLLGAGAGSVVTWDPYDPRSIAPGARVVVLSDAGLAAQRQGWPHDPAWVWLAEAWASGGVSAVLVSPYASDRYRRELRDLLPIVHWNDRLTARQVATALEDDR